MKKICDQAIDYLSEIGQEPGQKEDIRAIVDIEQKIDDMTEDYRQKQLERMQKGTCSEEGCIIYSEMLTDFERIGDHILNIGQEMGRGKVKKKKKKKGSYLSQKCGRVRSCLFYRIVFRTVL